ncbi:MAG TPA: DegT/DnrJ/EryC1/StrS family aminotransferase [Myxococcaceae bacterium]|nr:DegT/DnrJ/EryC1/StrS family aminotransferase [Myxococcaceae bacterium]
MNSGVKTLLSLPSDQDITGRDLGAEELALLDKVIQTGTLTSTKGTFTRTLEQRFAQTLGVKKAHACASGTAAVHLAVAAIDPNPGDEFVTTSITDMGALTPIIYQGAIPVFCDVDPVTLNVTAKTIEAALSPRTKAIIVTHLFGNPCDMHEIMGLARSRNLPVIEDCAQAFLSRSGRRFVGTFGSVGCFSMQQGKHMTTGEGGMVVSNDEALARRMFLFINKAWGYGDPNPDHYFLALNYRISELHAAVALAQLEKLPSVVDRRIAAAGKLTRMISGLKGIRTPKVAADAVHVYWKYCLTVDGASIRDGAVGLGKALKEFGIASAPRYIQKPAFLCEIFQKHRTFGNSRFPFTLARPEAVDYSKTRFPMTFKALEDVLVLPWNERYTDEHIEFIAEAIKESVERLSL